MVIFNIFFDLYQYWRFHPFHFLQGSWIITWGLSVCFIFISLGYGVYETNRIDMERDNIPSLWLSGGTVSIATPYHTPGDKIKIDINFILNIMEQYPQLIADRITYKFAGNHFIARYKNHAVKDISGVSSHYTTLLHLHIAQGRALNDMDEQLHRHVAVIDNADKSLLINLFGSDESPVGKTFEINAQPFRVVGYINNDHNFNSYMIHIPYTAIEDFKQSEELIPTHYYLKLKNPDIKKISQKLREIISKKLGIDSYDYSALHLSYSTYGLSFKKSLVIFSTSMYFIGALLFFLSVIAILQFITLSVKKRLHEISLRRILGASAYSIFLLLLMEISGYYLTGLVLSICITQLIISSVNLSALISYFGTLQLSYIGLCSVGILGIFMLLFITYFSTLRALKLNAIDAIEMK